MSTNEELFARAQRVIPGGVNSPVRAFRAVGGTPRFIRRAQGPHIWDAEGRRYIDYIGSWGPMILGHAHPDVQRDADADADGDADADADADADGDSDAHGRSDAHRHSDAHAEPDTDCATTRDRAGRLQRAGPEHRLDADRARRSRRRNHRESASAGDAQALGLES